MPLFGRWRKEGTSFVELKIEMSAKIDEGPSGSNRVRGTWHIDALAKEVSSRSGGCR